MKLSRKMKLALGLSLGAIVTTAAVTTMAVSCSDSNSSDSNSSGGSNSNSGNNIVTSSNYNPSPALASKISQEDINIMNTNLQNNVDESKKGLESSGATNVVVSASVSLQGDKLFQITKSSFTSKEGIKMTNDLTYIYTLVPNKDDKYLVEAKASQTENGVQKPAPGITPSQLVSRADLEGFIGDLYNPN